MAGLAGLVLVLLPPSAWAAEDVPRLDLAAAQRALLTEQVYSAPGAVAAFDPARVLPELPSDARVLIGPPRSLEDRSSFYDTVYDPMKTWADEQEVRLVLVTGLQVQVPGFGTLTQDELPQMRLLLAQGDVTESLRHAAQTLAGTDPIENSPTPDERVPPAPALVTEVVAGLRAAPLWSAPGVQVELSRSTAWADLVPGLPVRVAFLPRLPRGTPYPDLLPALRTQFPGELVVVVHGTWLEAAGPGQAEITSARNYVLGAYRRQLLERAVASPQVVPLFLERLGELRYGDAFRRPPVAPLTKDQLLERLAPWTALALALLLGGGSVVTWLRLRVRRRLAAARAYRHDHADVFARLSRLSADLLRVRQGGGLVAGAAERHATALHLFDQAEGSREPDVLAAADAAVREAQQLLLAARR